MIIVPRDDSTDEVPWWERGDISAVPAPPGFTSNFINPPSKASSDVVAQAVCLTCATLLVAMRMYTKVRVLKTSGWDDYISVLAWIGLVAMSIICLEEDRHGNGRHIWDITGYQYVAYAKVVYVGEIIYNPTIFFTKASILMLYIRVFKPMHRTIIVLHIVLWANFTFYLLAIFVEAFQCRPIKKAWYPDWPGDCINQRAGETASAAINTVSDFVILILPIANVWGLQLYKKGRAGLVVIFGFGVIACAASIGRLVGFAQKLAPLEGGVDETWDYYSVGVVSVAEITCGIICGCLPALPAFIRHVSGIRIRIIRSSQQHSYSRFTPWRSGTPQANSRTNKIRGGSTIPPSPATEMTKSPSPIGVKPVFPMIAEKMDSSRSRDNPWETLDELDSVAIDNMSPRTNGGGGWEPRPPPPIAK